MSAIGNSFRASIWGKCLNFIKMKKLSLIVTAILILGLITSCQEENESLRTDAEMHIIYFAIAVFFVYHLLTTDRQYKNNIVLRLLNFYRSLIVSALLLVVTIDSSYILNYWWLVLIVGSPIFYLFYKSLRENKERRLPDILKLAIFLIIIIIIKIKL